jgi:nucleotide sugar dehydrogenase
MEIIIAGYGFVGKAVSEGIKHAHTTCIVDPKYTTAEIKHFPMADGIVICVGTPSDPTGDCDVSQIYSVLDDTPIHIPVLIKSTVPPDYLEKIMTTYKDHSICYSPEFLRAATANEDFANQTYMVLGGDDPEGFWHSVFQSALPNCKVIFNTSITEASMIKYATNCFLSVKVTFFNQLYDTCKQNGADFNLVRQVLLHDKRIGNSHTMVPGTDGTRGFGGACFPKDTNAYMLYSDRVNQSHTLVESAIKYNKKIRKTLT